MVLPIDEAENKEKSFKFKHTEIRRWQFGGLGGADIVRPAIIVAKSKNYSTKSSVHRAMIWRVFIIIIIIIIVVVVV